MIIHSRIDFRLIHGQVMTQWIKRLDINRIVTVDDGVAAEDFLKEVFMMAAPKGVRVEIVSTEDAAKMQQEGGLEKDRCLMLFKTVPGLDKALKCGLKLAEVQVGGLGGGPGRRAVHNAITLDEKDAQTLKEIQDSGVRIYFQTTPDYAAEELDEVLAKFNRG